MAKGPKGEKRAADLNRRAFDIVRIATGEAEEAAPLSASERARKGGLKGGKARAAKLTERQRAEIAHTAAQARWKKP
jgi:hypothetical protein